MQYGRRNTIEVFGVPETEGENCYDRVVEIGKALDVALDHTSIDACHRLPKNKDMNMPAGIIVKFVQRGVKDALLSKRKLCKSFTTNNINMSGNHNIYLNQSLTPRRRKLFAMAKRAQSEKVVRHVWADRVGRVKVRKEDAGRVYVIGSEDDLKKLSTEKN
ncbi:uncharacterized protein LOC111045967 [Nilaparvata lugens]|uniref:uncharacterized protein LOC111045967 n=1 Tax=Nilaparvata lugens TaxID=108931 RepID=UPI00193E0E18|nr:uncharacterized protein LOC111045967 [Nilaparvata lugens]